VHGVALDLIFGVIPSEPQISLRFAPGEGVFAERMRFRLSYRSQTRAVAGAALKKRFIASARNVKALELQHRLQQQRQLLM
jgi:hypothetical protein